MVAPEDINTTAKGENEKAKNGKVYFVGNRDATNTVVSYTFKQTKEDDDVEGLFEATIPANKASSTYDEDNFYFDVYYKNNGKYAVKVIKVVD